MICININFIRSMKKNSLLPNFKYLDYPEWLIQAQAGQIRVTNNFTHDQFAYAKCTQNTPGLVQAYQARSLYQIPLTPQIILPPSNNQSEIEMLVECASEGLEKLIEGNNCQTVRRQLLKKITNTLQYLIKKFGFFQITPKMIRVTSSLKILIWINQDFSKIAPSFPIAFTNYGDCCKAVVLNLLAVFEKAGFCRKLAALKRRVEVEKSLTFQKFKHFIDVNLRCLKKTGQLLKANNMVPQFLLRDRIQSVSVEKTAKSKSLKKPNLTPPKPQIQQKQKSSPNKIVRTALSSRALQILDKSITFKFLNNSSNVLKSKRTASSSNLFGKFNETSLLNPEKSREDLATQVKENQNQASQKLKNLKKMQEKLAVSTYVDQFQNLSPEKCLKASQSAKTTLVQLETELNSLLLE